MSSRDSILDAKSVRARFFVSLGSNAARALLGFLGGLLVARGLSPSGYGDLMFLLGTFLSVRTLLDMGSSSAFYTFISRRPRGKKHYLFYFGWLGLQFTGTVLLVALVFPEEVIRNVWLGHPRGTILLAFVASFLQQQVWLTLSQIGEASRKTVRVQVLGLGVGFAHLCLVFALLEYGRIAVSSVLWLFVLEYVVAVPLALRFLAGNDGALATPAEERVSFGAILREYWGYCRPLIVISWLTFLGEFADRWLLQRFGGASQQGYFQVAGQFAAVSLLAATSITNIFWKEIAEAQERNDHEVVSALYHRISRSLYMLGAILSGFLIPWSEPIVTALLGTGFQKAAPVLSLMFLYPVHQSIGQIGSIMLLAGGRTRDYMMLTVVATAAGLPLAYLAQAPPSGMPIPGLGLGAVGMGIKCVILNVFSVNLLVWIVARHHRWKYDWLHQVAGLGFPLTMGYASRLAVGVLWNLEVDMGGVSMALPVLASGILYIALMGGLLWRMPWLIGMDRGELRVMAGQIRASCRFSPRTRRGG